MKVGPVDQATELARLFYPQAAALGEFLPATPAQLPEDYRVLLAHDDHMTVALEVFHDSKLSVKVLDEHREESSYSRASVLSAVETGRPVQFGVMQINLEGLPDPVRAAIHAGTTPLGRVLIRYNVLRRVELASLWQVKPGPVLRSDLQLDGPSPIYGRVARILVGGRPAVSLLEIVKV